MTTKKAVDVGAIALRVTAHPAPPPQPHARPIKDATATGPRGRTETVRFVPDRPVTARQGIVLHGVTATVRLPRVVTVPPMATDQPAPRVTVPSAQDLRGIARLVTVHRAVMVTGRLPRVVTARLMATDQPAPRGIVPSAQGLQEIVLPVIVPMVTAHRAAMATGRSPRVVTAPLMVTDQPAPRGIVPSRRVASVRRSGRARRAAKALLRRVRASKIVAAAKAAPVARNGKTVAPRRVRASRTALPK